MDWSLLGPPVDVRPLFPLERRHLVSMLRQLDASAWDRATVCPGWTAGDIVAHLVHDYLRRLSGTRDGHRRARIKHGEDLPAFLARINGDFVASARGLSPRVLIDLITHLGPQLDDLWAAMHIDGLGGVDVWWVAPGENAPVWLDVAREYTEFWVHQQQIRDAVDLPGADQEDLLRPVVSTFLKALPHAMRHVSAAVGTAVTVEVAEPAGGEWTVTKTVQGWRLDEAAQRPADASVSMSADTLWRLATRGITPATARPLVTVYGDDRLASAALGLVSIIR